MLRTLTMVALASFAVISFGWAQDCTLTITVVDAEDHSPLPAAEVQIRGKGDDKPFNTTLTDKNGTAAFHALSSGTPYFFEARVPGYSWRQGTFLCNQGAAPYSIELSPIVSVSIVQLIADPTRWHGRPVRVQGYLNLQFEGNGLYLHKEDWKHGLTRNAIWVETLDSECLTWAKLNRKYVLLEGTFDAYRNGHMGAFGGELGKVTRCEPWK